MITAFGLSNFRCFADPQQFRTAPLTLIFGPNSSGKSALIQSLVLLKQSLALPNDFSWRKIKPKATLVPRGDLIDFGSFKGILHNHDKNRPMNFTVEFDLSDNEERIFLPQSRQNSDLIPMQSLTLDLQYSTAMECAENTLDVNSRALLCRVGIDYGGESPVVLERTTVPPSEILYSQAKPGTSYFRLADRKSAESLLDNLRVHARITTFEMRDGELISKINTDLDSLPILPEQVVECLANGLFISNHDEFPWTFLPTRRGPLVLNERNIAFDLDPTYNFYDIEMCFRSVLDRISYLGPLRSYPQRYYVGTDEKVTSVGSKGELFPQALYLGDQNLIESLNKWFHRSEIPYSLHLNRFGDDTTGELISIALTDLRNGCVVSPADVGFGLGQCLPILLEGVMSSRKIICLEQPEIHLHPRLQAHLSDFFLETSCVRNSEEGNQWIIETHSEALMLRLQRRIREGQISPHAICVLYVLPGVNGESQVLELRLDEEGRFLDQWPGGFFEESYFELLGE